MRANCAKAIDIQDRIQCYQLITELTASPTWTNHEARDTADKARSRRLLRWLPVRLGHGIRHFATGNELRDSEHCAHDVDSNTLHRPPRMPACADYLIGERAIKGR